MASAGILGEDDRVELINGEIVQTSPIGSRHAACVTDLSTWFIQQLGDRAITRVQNPVTLNDLSEPEPDVALVRPRAHRYRARHPGPDDVFLIVEAADATLALDRRVKSPLYAASGIPELWIVDLEHETVEVLRRPSPKGYQDVQQVGPGGSVSPEAFPDLACPVSGFLAR